VVCKTHDSHTLLLHRRWTLCPSVPTSPTSCRCVRVICVRVCKCGVRPIRCSLVFLTSSIYDEFSTFYHPLSYASLSTFYHPLSYASSTVIGGCAVRHTDATRGMHANTHTHTHKRTHTYTHAHTHTRTHTHTHTHTHARTHPLSSQCPDFSNLNPLIPLCRP
jgi:hypothetical protein